MSSEIGKDKTTVRLTRGDTFISDVHAKIKDSEEEYTPEPGDKIRFALKHDAVKTNQMGFVDEEPLIEKNIDTSTMILRLEPEDTKPLPFGRYAYDIELTHADGRVDTFIADAKFILTREIH